MTGAGIPHLIADVDLFDSDNDWGEDLLELLVRSVTSKIGEISCVRLWTGSNNPVLVTTGFYVNNSDYDMSSYAPLLWLRRFYWYNQEAGVVRFNWLPVKGNVRLGSVPKMETGSGYKFTCMADEACWVVFKLVVLVASLECSSNIPEPQNEWFKGCEVLPDRQLEHPLIHDDGSVNDYVWTKTARLAYESR